jgi:hypothetical protein
MPDFFTPGGVTLYNDAMANGIGFIPGEGQLVAILIDTVTFQDLMIWITRPPVLGFEGLTLGFWKNHPDLWSVYSPSQTFYSVFGVIITIKLDKDTITNPTLMQALKAQARINESKGVYDALARHAVAALLNAAHPNVDYPLTIAQIINAVKGVINGSNLTDAEPLKNLLEGYNSLGGGIDAHGIPI